MLQRRSYRIPRPILFALVALLLAFGALVVYAALPAPDVDLVPSGAISPATWSPDANPSAKWETGNPGDYAEGDVVPITFWINPASIVIDQEYQVYLCLQVEDGANAPYKYGFSAAAPWDTTVTPASLPAGNQSALISPVPAYTDTRWDITTDPVVWGFNVDIVNVDGPERGTGNTTAPFNDCDDNYLGALVKFTVTSQATTDDGAWIVFGGRFAKAGDLIPATSLDPNFTNVPIGYGASAINGNFQARIGGAGDKTINYSGVAAPTAIALADLTAQGGALPLLLLAAALGLGLVSLVVYGRSRSRA